MEQSLVLHCFTDITNKEISQGKLFILFGKVKEKSGKMNSAK